MEPELKKINELLLGDRSKKKRKIWPIFIKIFIWTLILAIPISLILFTPLFEKREIMISSKDSTTKKIIDLGFWGFIFPSKIKDKERVNLLFLGVPGQGHNAPELTDTIIIINSTPKGENAVGISIPRDLFVKNPEKKYYTKINSIYQNNGIEAVKKVIEEITDLEIDYFIVFDLGGVKKIIDQFDGIDIFVEKDIYDPRFPGPNDSYTIFRLEKGNQHLDGETALRYIRSRNQPEGDFARIKRQQQIINILKDKILSLNLIWNFSTILKTWKTLKEHTHTDIELSDMKYAWGLIKKSDLNNINFVTISNQLNEEIPLLVSDNVMIGGVEAYILSPRAGLNNYEEIKNYINQKINNL